MVTFPDKNLIADITWLLSNFPRYLMTIISFGWLPGAVAFPALIYIDHGAMSLVIFEMFALSFLSGWLVSLTLSILLASYTLLSCVLPKTLNAHIAFSALGAPLRSLTTYIPYLRLLAGTIPLIGAIMLILPNSQINLAKQGSSEAVIISLIVIGMICFTAAFTLGEKIKNLAHQISSK